MAVCTLSTAAFATPLDDYVALPDASYSWSLATTIPGAGYTDYVIDLKSQTWDPIPPNGVDRPLWEHALIITVPDTVSHTSGMLFIGGGDNPANLSGGNDAFLIAMAIRSQSVIAQLKQVPNQPLTFANDPLAIAREEDEQIAYCWRKFLDAGGDPEDAIWLSRLPMTKAAVRAMDAMTAFLATPAGGSLALNQFVVSGGSKRGWTTWTTAAVDSRVIAIAPLVIDLLNMERSFVHHFQAIGGYADAVHDYTDHGIFEYQNTPEYDRLQEYVEPFSYRDRLTMPKFIMNSSQDQFFLPDSSQFYWDRLVGEKRLRYVQNNNHGLSQTADAASDLEAWYTMILNGVPRPDISWVKRDDGQIEVEIISGTPIVNGVRLWQSSTQPERKFGWPDVGNTGIYSDTVLAESSPGKYVTNVTIPGSGFKAFFVEVTFPSGGTFPFRVTTEVSIVPDVLPFGPQYALGSETELLDAAYYAGEASDGSNVAGRWGFFGRASNDATKVAFWAVNASTFMPSIFLVDVGAPSSWRRITSDFAASPDAPIYWTPDDSALFVGGSKIVIPPVGQLATITTPLNHGFSLNDTSMTALANNNWAFALSSGEVVALPILVNGDEDPFRDPVYVTNFTTSGVSADWPSVSPDGTSLTFADYHGVGALGVAPDLGDIYGVENLEAILAAPKLPATDISSLAPTSANDPDMIKIRTAESENFAHTPAYSQDKSLIFFSEDWNNVFADDDYFPSFLLGDFDIMVANADGFEADVRLAEPGNQGLITPTHGGTRFTFIRDIAAVPHLYMSTLEITVPMAGTQLGNNDILTVVPQTASDASGTSLRVPAATTINYPNGADQEIAITTPIDPVSSPQLPAGIDAIPVVREFGPDGTTFSPALEVTISYTDAEVDGLDESTMRVFRFNTGTGTFSDEITTIIDRDTVANTITFTLNSFSTYGLGAEQGAPLVDTDDDGIPDISDPDDDNDGIADGSDAFPLDTDNDGQDNAVDTDDDNDGISDEIELLMGTDPLNPFDTPALPVSNWLTLLILSAVLLCSGLLLAFRAHKRCVPK
ncbi:MAG: PhoPQ-activated protein PqaA family protein [Candidatus Hydrogenedentes bacterium]|nr:PhoPQ-activated protein PqaA family protein [Candidatus Hydrogenedentota bacterium]